MTLLEDKKLSNQTSLSIRNKQTRIYKERKKNINKKEKEKLHIFTHEGTIFVIAQGNMILNLLVGSLLKS